ncbi:MAG TPA: thioesterase family protein [Puia sp.]
MPRIKIDLPETFSFTTSFAVRVTDLNYGNHVGNDKVLSFLHEARMQFLQSLGYSEFNLEGISLIMADAALVFKNEMYYGDELLISIRASDFSRIGFELLYKIEKKWEGKMTVTAEAKTLMICFDYKLKKVVNLPEPARMKLSI